MNVIMKELAATTGGAMARSTDTAAGQMKIMKNQTAELQESLGTALLPVVEALIPVMVKLADIASENTGVIKILVGIVAALAATILIANAAMKAYAAAQAIVKAATAAWTAAQWLLNAALTANPIGLIIVAIAALAAGIYLAYTRSATFRNIVSDAMGAVTGAVKALDARVRRAPGGRVPGLELDHRPLETRPLRVRADRRRRLPDRHELRPDQGGRPGRVRLHHGAHRRRHRGHP